MLRFWNGDPRYNDNDTWLCCLGLFIYFLVRFSRCCTMYILKHGAEERHATKWYRGKRIVFWWPNTNTNIIRLFKNYWIRIRILFASKMATEYEYEYYSVWKKQPNTNTNIIWFEKNNRIRILFDFSKMTDYKYEYRSG